LKWVGSTQRKTNPMALGVSKKKKKKIKKKKKTKKKKKIPGGRTDHPREEKAATIIVKKKKGGVDDPQLVSGYSKRTNFGASGNPKGGKTGGFLTAEPPGQPGKEKKVGRTDSSEEKGAIKSVGTQERNLDQNFTALRAAI